MTEPRDVVIGAGPAGLTAAIEFNKKGRSCIVLEADDVVGGISRTVEREGWRFDIGGHRFFTKVGRVDEFWHSILSDDEFLRRPRLSRIYYNKTFFDYPLKAMNALGGLGVIESIRCVLSYAWVRIRPPKDTSTFEGWTASRFGWRLYRIFFKTYTEKVWGVPATTIQADWAAQRIKNLSLARAILNALSIRKGSTKVTSLIDEFKYPKFGPGMMWEKCAELVTESGSLIEMNSLVTLITRDGGRATSVMYLKNGLEYRIEAKSIISSMPISELIRIMQPPAPATVLAAAEGLRYRDFLTVALVLPDKGVFPDNWIYIHDPEVHVGRIQNFGSWSPYMVKPGLTCLGLEYFVNEGDRLWTMSDADLKLLAIQELKSLDLVDASSVVEGFVVRMPKAYPMYDGTYQQNVMTIRRWLETEVSNVYPVGRNGMHRYNNQDHSMLTAMLAVENICGATNNIWDVNVEEDYHEEVRK
ncbi:MAG: NAD(P)/FAD-dependent oxidoreductase [Actinobacteria bacterium]|nr:NAD(P)/FAD-dependent oxidoreductase [Actinomycetota bacterium]